MLPKLCDYFISHYFSKAWWLYFHGWLLWSFCLNFSSVTNVMRCERRVTVYIPFDLLYFELPLKHFLSFKILIDFPSNPDFSQPHDLDKALLEDLAVKVPIAHYFSCIFQLLIISSRLKRENWREFLALPNNIFFNGKKKSCSTHQHLIHFSKSLMWPLS